MNKRRLPSGRFLVFTVLVATLPLLISRLIPKPEIIAQPYTFPSAELADLDKVIQDRFAVVPDNDFGMARIGARHAYFEPVTKQEKEVIQRLGHSKQEIAFYVVPRNIYKSQDGGLGPSPVQGPVYMTAAKPIGKVRNGVRYGAIRFFTQNPVPEDLPSDEEVISAGRAVFEDPVFKNGKDGKAGSWKAVAVPVLASSQVCVDCHNSRAPWKRKRGFFESRRDYVAIGDILGTAVYCYRAARNSKQQQLDYGGYGSLTVKTVER